MTAALATTASPAGAAPHATPRPRPTALPRPASNRSEFGSGRGNAIQVDRSHLFVKFRSHPSDLTARLARAGSRVRHAVGRTGWTTLDVSDAYAAKARLAHDPAIAKVEYSTEVHAFTVPNDPKYASAQKSYLAGLRMDRAWDLSKGAGVTVGVLDTGVDFSHPDMTGRFASFGYNEVSGSGAASDDNYHPDPDPRFQEDGHGTMTSGLIAANSNNGRGIAGIAPQSKIFPVKVLDDVGSGTSTMIVDGLEDIAALPDGQRPQVISMSLGGPGPGDVECAAIQDVINQDVVVVVAAGNSMDDSVAFPSGCPGVISVSATTHAGALASFSTYGTQIDIAAPGVDITSTALSSPPSNDAYATHSGTSFSTPIVAGVAALIRSQNPGFTAQQTIDRLLSTARDVGQPGVDKAYGHGIVDPVAALGGAPLAPDPALVDDGDSTPATATPLSADVPHGAFIAPETDEDWYSLSLATGWYKVSIPIPVDSGGHPLISPSVELYDTANHFLAASTDYSGIIDFVAHDSGADAFHPLVFHASSPGTYRLRVRNVAGAAVPYTITVASISTPPALSVDLALDSFFPFQTQSVAVGNLDGDSRKDVALLMGDNSFFCDGLLVMHQTPNHGLGSLELSPTDFQVFSCPPSPPVAPGGGLVLADATGDGRDDAVFPVLGGVEITPQAAEGGFDPAAATTLPTGTVKQIAIADVDGDTHNDLVTAGSSGVKIYWGMSLSSPTTITGTSASSLAVGEFSGDGQLDIAATTGSGVGAAVNTGARSFTSFAPTPLSNARAVAIDAAADHIVVTQGSSPGAGAVVVFDLVADAPHQLSTSPVLPKASALALGDLDGDATTDAFMTYDASSLVSFVPAANGSETHVGLGVAPPATFDAHAVAIGDVLGAGAPEAIVSTTGGPALVRHRLDGLTTDHGSRLLDDFSPTPLATGVLASVTPALTLTQAATNADDTTVQLLDKNGVPVDADVTGTTTVTITPTAPLPDGAYTIAVDGLHDAAGDSIDGFRSGFIVGAAPDENPPSATLSGPSGFQTVNHATMTFSTNDGGATKWCSRDNEVFRTDICASGTVAMNNLSAAAHTFSFFARDAAGNESAVKTVSWTYRPPPHGYWMLGAQGGVYRFGTAPGFGSPNASGAVDIEVTPTGFGYWVVDNRGRVFALGDAGYYGGAPALPAGESVTSISRTKLGKGYWLFTSKGRVIPRGDAKFFGDKHTTPLNGPVLDSVATPSGNGYYMVASDGGVFAFGDARFRGSMGGKHVSAPVRTLTPDADGDGYWLIGRDGGVYAFNATFRGSLAGKHLNKPVVGAVPFGNGYLMVASDGGVFNFSNRAFYGSLGGHPPSVPIVSIAAFG